MRILVLIMIFLCFKSFAQTDNNSCYFFGRLIDDFGPETPIVNAKVKLEGTEIYTKSDFNGYFSLKFPFETFKNTNKFIFELENSNYENDTITLRNIYTNQILNFYIRQKEPIIDPYYGSGTMPRCQYEQYYASDSLVYFIYGFIQESKTKYNLTGINITITDEKGNYLIETNCCVSRNGFYSYKIPRQNIYGRKCTITYSANNFETVVAPFLFKEKYILQKNVLMNYLNSKK